MYEGGLGVNQDLSQAASWFRKSAEQGNAPAQSVLGGMYLNGKGVARDNTVAASWIRKSAEQGYPPAQYILGIMYTEGIGVPVDNQQAVIWFRKSAEQSIAPAQNALGWMYLSGKGVAQDNTEAASWFRRSADQGDASGQFYLGSMYLRGQGVAQDNVEAVRLLRKSADQGNVAGQAALGSLYVTGTALPRNCSDAARWFRKAGEGGHPDYRGFFAAREALGHIWSSYFYYIERYALFRRTVRQLGETSAGKILVEEQGESVRLSCGRRGMTVSYPFLKDEVLLDIFQGMKSLVTDCLDGEKDGRESESERRILTALLSSLEKSSYHSCEEVGFLILENMDNPGWIGVEFQAGDSGLRVVESFDEGPAFRAGIREGDKIVEVDGRTTEKLPVAEARKLLTGKPGTTVHLRVFTRDSSGAEKSSRSTLRSRGRSSRPRNSHPGTSETGSAISGSGTFVPTPTSGSMRPYGI
jgi:TPR repeat protein